MGVGICVTGSPRAKKVPREQMFDRIENALRGAVADPFLARWLKFERQEHTLYARVHPLGENLEFQWEPSGRVVAMTKTSTVGPGYHAYLIDTLNVVAPNAELEWDWSEDETQFARDGDFAGLQREMLGWLQGMANAFPEDAEGTIGINVPLNLSGPPDAFTYTPIGTFDRAWWKEVGAGKNLEQHAREFFPWWNRPHDAAAAYKLGIGLMWCDVCWRPPADEHEATVARLALDTLEHACASDPSLNLPVAEMNELAEALDFSGEGDPPTPAADGIGYLRLPQSRQLPSGWSIQAPGYFYQDWNEEEGVIVFGFGDRTIHASSYSVDPKKRRKAAALLAEVTEHVKSQIEIRMKSDDLVGAAFVEETVEDDWHGFSLCGWTAADDNFAHVTITFKNPADRTWAEQVWRSVRFASPTDDDA